MTADLKWTYYALLVILFYASGFIDVIKCRHCPKSGSLITPEIVGFNFSCNYVNAVIATHGVIEWDNGLSSNIAWNALIAKGNEFSGKVTSGPFNGLTIKISFHYPDITLDCLKPEGVTHVNGVGFGTIGFNPFIDTASSNYSPGITNTEKPTNITYTDYIRFFPLFPLYC